MTELCQLPASKLVELLSTAHDDTLTVEYLPLGDVLGYGLDIDGALTLVDPVTRKHVSGSASKAALTTALAAVAADSVVSVYEANGVFALTDASASATVTPHAGVRTEPTVSAPAVRPLSLRQARKPHTQAYNVIDAALRLSGATNGAPLVKQRGHKYLIAITPALRYHVDTSSAHATTVSVIAGGRATTTHYPVISAHEFVSLFLLWKQEEGA